MRGRRLVMFVIVTAVVLWQMRTSSPPAPRYPVHEVPPAGAQPGSEFDPARCGRIAGTVRWAGEQPVAEPIELIQVANPPEGKSVVTNPNAPRISSDGQLADAIVFLTRVDADRSKGWDLPDAGVEVTRQGIVVRQGSRTGSYGVVRRGAEVEFVSREANLHSARGRGAAFFTQMLPIPNQPVRRVMPEDGMVELSSGSGYYWLRGYLVVSGHPYVSITGTDGGFRLDQVPDGEYEVVCWKANWHVERMERDPEWLGPVRLYYRQAVEHRKRVTVKAGQPSAIDFSLSAADFGPSSR